MSMPRKYFTPAEVNQARANRRKSVAEFNKLAVAIDLVREVRLQIRLQNEASDEPIAQSLLDRYRILRK